jgi:tRNA-modifying protein YgfZ
MVLSVPELTCTDHRGLQQNMPHCLLDDLGVLQFRGPDAQTFLQGQLSNDIGLLSANVLLRAGLHNPQGRTLALLSMLSTPEGGVLAFVPRELIATVATHLKRYVLRAKVTIVEETASLRIYGLSAPDGAYEDAGVLCRYGAHGDERRLLLQSASQSPLTGPQLTRAQWLAIDIASGLPSVSSAISAAFVAQMLNLDCIDAISFTKGCYTGQEVIARAHYRGRVKRRMQRFLSHAPLKLLTGESGRLDDGRAFRVVAATNHDDGRCEFLAVARLAVGTQDSEEAAEPSSAEVRKVTEVSALPLPYALPE